MAETKNVDIILELKITIVLDRIQNCRTNWMKYVEQTQSDTKKKKLK